LALLVISLRGKQDVPNPIERRSEAIFGPSEAVLSALNLAVVAIVGELNSLCATLLVVAEFDRLVTGGGSLVSSEDCDLRGCVDSSLDEASL
jgi:hypothetical protein